MKKILIWSLFIVFCSLFIAPALAQDATDSGSISDEEVKENVKERLEKVAGTTTDTKKAYVGTLESLTQTTLTLNTATGSKQAAASDAKIISKNRENLEIDDLEIGSHIIVMGYVQENDVLEGKRIVVSDKPLTSDYQPTLTKITKISKNVVTTEAGELTLTETATITQTFETNQTEIEVSDLKVDDTIVILAKKDDDALETVALHLPKGRAIISEPSVTPTASPEE